MFYIDYIDGKKIVRSDLIKEADIFFTTRDLCIFSKNKDMSYNKNIVKKYVKQELATNKPIHDINIEKVDKNKIGIKILIEQFRGKGWVELL